MKIDKKIIISLLTIILIILGVSLLLGYENYSKNKNSSPPTSSKDTTENKIYFPAGGETLIKNQTYTLKWKSSEPTVDIFLIDKSLESSGVSVSLADRVYEVKNIGSYEYKVPENIPDGEYKFTIGKLSSNYFKISSPQVNNQ